jgi:predicted nucleic acid-binding protein
LAHLVVNYLVDTNIWLERMLDQEHAVEVAELLNHLTIISLDADFDRTDNGRQTPARVVRQLEAEVEDE